MSNHTPGPWELERDGSLVIGGEVCMTITSMPGSTPEERHANAALISAALDMAEALKGAWGALADILNAAHNHEPYSSEELEREFVGVHDRCQSALEKAGVL